LLYDSFIATNQEKKMSMSGRNTRAIHTDSARIAARLKYHKKLMLKFCDYGHSTEVASRMAYNITIKTSDKKIRRELCIA
jgi:hypothetical protein